MGKKQKTGADEVKYFYDDILKDQCINAANKLIKFCKKEMPADDISRHEFVPVQKSAQDRARKLQKNLVEIYEEFRDKTRAYDADLSDLVASAKKKFDKFEEKVYEIGQLLEADFEPTDNDWMVLSRMSPPMFNGYFSEDHVLKYLREDSELLGPRIRPTTCTRTVCRIASSWS